MIHITISEMINNVTVLSSLLMNIIGTKEGVIVKITKKNKETYKGLSIDIINIHYDQVNKVIIDNDCAVTCSYNEIAVNDLS